MKKKIKLAKIVKFDYKNEGLVVSPIRPFIFTDLIGKNLFLVPPELDKRRSFMTIDVSKTKGGNLFLKTDGEFNFGGKFVLGDISLDKKKIVIDKKLGEIGILKYIDDSGPQSRLIVDYDGREVIIPNVSEFVSIEDNIIVDLPDGLLDL